MVYLKVSDGNETRKLQVTPGEITFDQLKEQLATFFPRTLSESSSGLSLQYHDTDGDLITLSSDQELQDALSQLQEDGVWKLFISNGRRGGAERSAQGSQRRNGCEASLFHRLFEPSVRPLGLLSSVWDDLEQHLKLLHQLHSDVFSTDAKADSTTENQQKGTSSEAASNSEAATTPSPSEQQAEDPDEVVKSKPQAADSENKEENTSNGDSSSKSQWHTRKFVTWEPRVHVGPFGFFHSHLTPVVYKVSFRSSSDGGCCSTAKGDKKTTEKASPAAPAREEETEQTLAGSATTVEAQTQSSEAATVTAQ